MKSKKFFLLFAALLIAAVSAALAIYIDGLCGFGATLAMAPIAGYTRACAASSGGVSKLYITNAANVTSFTLSTDEYNAVTMSGGAVFYEYQFEQDMCEYKEDGKLSNGAWMVTHAIESKLDKMNKVLRTEIMALADASPCGLIAIVRDTKAQHWVVGYSEENLKDRPLRLVGDATATGKKIDDATGSTLTFESTDTAKAMLFTGTVPVTP